MPTQYGCARWRPSAAFERTSRGRRSARGSRRRRTSRERRGGRAPHGVAVPRSPARTSPSAPPIRLPRHVGTRPERPRPRDSRGALHRDRRRQRRRQDHARQAPDSPTTTHRRRDPRGRRQRRSPRPPRVASPGERDLPGLHQVRVYCRGQHRHGRHSRPRDEAAIAEAARKRRDPRRIRPPPPRPRHPARPRLPGRHRPERRPVAGIAIARSLYALAKGAQDSRPRRADVGARRPRRGRVLDRFVELTRGVTSILISHRFSSVRRADHIVVIERGR